MPVPPPPEPRPRRHPGRPSQALPSQDRSAPQDTASAPVTPGRKPESRQPSTPAQAQKADKGDRAARLLAFGRPPVPDAKPFTMTSGPLSDKDRKRYRRIFTLQERGDIQKAASVMEKVRNIRLRGHVLYQRYMHPTAYRSGFWELKTWLDRYSAHPGARDIYKLAKARMPQDFDGSLRKPEQRHRIYGALEQTSMRAGRHMAMRGQNGAEMRQASSKVMDYIMQGWPTGALNYLESNVRGQLDNAQYDRLRARIAMSYLHEGYPGKAIAQARPSVRRSGSAAPVAAWVAGLTSWKQNNYKQAADYFETVANSQYASGWTVSGGAYWAARSHMRAGNFERVNNWLAEAAKYPRTFYGLLALQSLGHDFDFNWRMPEFTRDDKKLILAHKAGRRALSLIRVGQSHRADAEIRGMDIDNKKRLRRALLAFAHKHGLSAFSMKYANAYRDGKGRLYDAALYPVPRWHPDNGFRIDRAVIYALVRQESRFNPLAENPSGATGLMQLLPSTANYVADKQRYHDRLGRYLLKNPRTNLRIGQQYVQHLLEKGSVDGDLLNMAIAYNAGPGNLRKWRGNSIADNDPLLFIETIPAGQTRAYVERVLRNIWIYRIRLGQQIPSLRALASGERARYVALDDKRGVELADTISARSENADAVKPQSESAVSDDEDPVWTRQ